MKITKPDVIKFVNMSKYFCTKIENLFYSIEPKKVNKVSISLANLIKVKVVGMVTENASKWLTLGRNSVLVGWQRMVRFIKGPTQPHLQAKILFKFL